MNAEPPFNVGEPIKKDLLSQWQCIENCARSETVPETHRYTRGAWLVTVRTVVHPLRYSEVISLNRRKDLVRLSNTRERLMRHRRC